MKDRERRGRKCAFFVASIFLESVAIGTIEIVNLGEGGRKKRGGMIGCWLLLAGGGPPGTDGWKEGRKKEGKGYR